MTLKRSFILQMSALFNHAVRLEPKTGLYEAFSRKLQWTNQSLSLSTSIYPSAKWRGSIFQSTLGHKSYCKGTVTNWKNFQNTLLVILHGTAITFDCFLLCFLLSEYVWMWFLIVSPHWWMFLFYFFSILGAVDSFRGGLKLLGRLALLTEKDLWTVNGLPNENNSSDHLPLLAEFRLIER